MKSPAVRRATPADVDSVHAIAASRPFAAKWSKADLLSELSRPDSLFLIAEKEGYALARIEDGEARLLDFAVSADGRGTGRALLKALLEGAKAAGAAKVTLEVSALNTRALDFYKAAGGLIVGRRKKFYDDGSDAVLFDVALAP